MGTQSTPRRCISYEGEESNDGFGPNKARYKHTPEGVVNTNYAYYVYMRDKRYLLTPILDLQGFEYYECLPYEHLHTFLLGPGKGTLRMVDDHVQSKAKNQLIRFLPALGTTTIPGSFCVERCAAHGQLAYSLRSGRGNDDGGFTICCMSKERARRRCWQGPARPYAQEAVLICRSSPAVTGDCSRCSNARGSGPTMVAT